MSRKMQRTIAGIIACLCGVAVTAFFEGSIPVGEDGTLPAAGSGRAISMIITVVAAFYLSWFALSKLFPDPSDPTSSNGDRS